MFETILRALGRAVVAVLEGIWRYLCLPLLQAAGQGLAAVLRPLAPIAAVGGAFYGLMLYQPELLNELVTIAIFAVVMWLAIRWALRGLRGATRQQERRR